MKFPDAVTIRRAIGPDEFGNPGASFEGGGEVTTAQGFLMLGSSTHSTGGVEFSRIVGTLFLPAGTDLRIGDHVDVGGREWTLRSEPEALRSPSKPILTIATLTPLEG